MPMRSFIDLLFCIRKSKSKSASGLKRFKSKVFPLHWSFVFVGYAFAFAVVGVCIYCIVLFGAALGETLVTQWLIAMVIGILKSIFVIQPLKVTWVHILYTLFCSHLAHIIQSDSVRWNETCNVYRADRTDGVGTDTNLQEASGRRGKAPPQQEHYYLPTCTRPATLSCDSTAKSESTTLDPAVANGELLAASGGGGEGAASHRVPPEGPREGRAPLRVSARYCHSEGRSALPEPEYCFRTAIHTKQSGNVQYLYSVQHVLKKNTFEIFAAKSKHINKLII